MVGEVGAQGRANEGFGGGGLIKDLEVTHLPSLILFSSWN